MVRLGFIKDGLLAPREYRRVYVKAVPGMTDFSTTAYSNPNADGTQSFELACEAPPEIQYVEHWAPIMAGTLSDLGWKHWWLDTHSIGRAFNRYIAEAMKRWGLAFWPHYERESTVLIQVGIERLEISKGVAYWEHQFPHLRVSQEHDFDKNEEELAQQLQPKKSGGMFGLFKKK